MPIRLDSDLDFLRTNIEFGEVERLDNGSLIFLAQCPNASYPERLAFQNEANRMFARLGWCLKNIVVDHGMLDADLIKMPD